MLGIQYEVLAQIHIYSTFCSNSSDIIQVDDGFLVTGRSACDFMVLKTDDNGDSIWQKTYPLEAVGVGEVNIF